MLTRSSQTLQENGVETQTHTAVRSAPQTPGVFLRSLSDPVIWTDTRRRKTHYNSLGHVFLFNINLMWVVLLIAICEDHHHCGQSSILTITQMIQIKLLSSLMSEWVNGSRLVTAFDDHIHYEAIKKLSDEGRTDRCVIVSCVNKSGRRDGWLTAPLTSLSWGWRTAMLDSRQINTPLHESFHTKPLQ